MLRILRAWNGSAPRATDRSRCPPAARRTRGARRHASRTGYRARAGDYIGSVVNIAARVSAAATGGEVLLTAQTAAVAPHVEGFLHESRGRQTLRNLGDPLELVAAVRQGDASERGLAIDPDCRMAVEPEHAGGRLTYDDITYFSCTLTCAGAFAQDPHRFTR
jgi:adenylate cyclase